MARPYKCVVWLFWVSFSLSVVMLSPRNACEHSTGLILFVSSPHRHFSDWRHHYDCKVYLSKTIWELWKVRLIIYESWKIHSIPGATQWDRSYYLTVNILCGIYNRGIIIFWYKLDITCDYICIYNIYSITTHWTVKLIHKFYIFFIISRWEIVNTWNTPLTRPTKVNVRVKDITLQKTKFQTQILLWALKLNKCVNILAKWK